MVSFSHLGETPFELTYSNPFRDEVSQHSEMPKDIANLIAEYADEQPKVEKVTLTNWETARKIVLCIVTLGLWGVYQTYQYKKIILHSVAGSGLNDAIKALKKGADPSCFAMTINYNRYSYDPRHIKERLMTLRVEKQYTEYEFAFAQLNDSDKERTFSQDLNTLIGDPEIWKILNKYKGNETFERNLMDKFVNKYSNISTRMLREIIDSKKFFEIIDNRFGEHWHHLNHTWPLIHAFYRQNDIESIKKVLVRCSEHDKKNVCEWILNHGYHHNSEILAMLLEFNFPFTQKDFDKGFDSGFNNPGFISGVIISGLIDLPGIVVKDTQLQRAIRYENQEMVELLALHHPRPFKEAIQLNNQPAIQWMLSIGLHPDHDDIALARDNGLILNMLIRQPKQASNAMSQLLAEEVARSEKELARWRHMMELHDSQSESDSKESESTSVQTIQSLDIDDEVNTVMNTND